MKETTTTVKFEHRLNKPFEYELYGKNILPVGHVLKTSKTEGKFLRYGVEYNHNASAIEIPVENVTVYKVTRKTTVEITEEEA